MSRVVKDLDFSWRFKRGDNLAGFNPKLDHSNWEEVQVPHDWSIEGPFKEDNPSGPRGGYAPGGIAWYRKFISLSEEYKNKKVFIEFDGIYMNSSVYVNGDRVGYHPYGYTSLSYDLTPYFVFGDYENLISVRVDTALQPGSRWYSGAGIYRHARLVVKDYLSIERYSTYITTPKVSEISSLINIKTSIKNEYAEEKTCVLKVSILDKDKKVVKTIKEEKNIDSNSVYEFNQDVIIEKPNLWSTENPYLYTERTEIIVDNIIVDNEETSVGIRKIEFNADKGFLLNDKSLKIKGVCIHHDGGCLGAAGRDRTKERQIEILKEMGCNAIRTSHNPPSPVLLDLCDKHGMLVMDEAFDEWEIGKRPRVFDEGTLGEQIRRPIYAYSEYFKDWCEKDLRTMVKRDRNHPSIILWSIGNEVDEHALPQGFRITKKLNDIIRSEDVTRPITTATVHMEGSNEIGLPSILDITGYNYHENLYEEDHEKYPNRIILGSETCSATPFEVRGEYKGFIESADSIESLKNIKTGGGDLSVITPASRFCKAENSWKITKENEYVSGLFIWTGFDYIGEPSPFAWPSKSSYFGVIDLCGFPKDAFYFYKSQWTKEPMIHILPHWNWEGKEGQELPVWCYTNCESVELILNGESLGEKNISDSEFLHLYWKVMYTPGSLKAIGKINGEVVCEEVINTASQPSTIILAPDKMELNSNGQDLCYIKVRIEDEKGNLVPTAKNEILFTVEGSGKLVGMDNGDPTVEESFTGNKMKALNGLCLAVVQSSLHKGEITIKATSLGLKDTKVVIRTN